MPIVPAYIAFKAIAVPQGRHVVRFELAGSALTSPVRTFAWLAGLIVFGALAFALLAVRRGELAAALG